jgi:DNA-binding NtrC family response regulator
MIMEKSIAILLVDDDADDRKLFFESVKEVDESISCISCAGCQEALAYLKDGGNPLPDYIFLDLRMPGLSGEKCLQEIKKDARILHIPVIVYSTSREVSESIALKKMGAAHFMSKPTAPEEVYFMISFVLNEKWK